MSFGGRETSRRQGRPISLFLFRYGVNPLDYHAYTDHEQTWTHTADYLGTPLTVTYQPIPISCEEISASGNLDKAGLVIELPENAPVIDLFRDRTLSSSVTMSIRQGHRADPDSQFLVNWIGRVVSFATANDVAQISTEPVSTAIERTGLRRHYQYGCPHVLYGPRCNALKVAATINRVVIGMSGVNLNVGAAWEAEARVPKYIGGLAEWTRPDGRKEIRTILQATAAGLVVVNDEVDGLETGMTIQLVLGCNHKTGLPGFSDDGDCHPLHNNIRNFGGHPWIPTKNPIGYVNNYW